MSIKLTDDEVKMILARRQRLEVEKSLTDDDIAAVDQIRTRRFTMEDIGRTDLTPAEQAELQRQVFAVARDAMMGK